MVKVMVSNQMAVVLVGLCLAVAALPVGLGQESFVPDDASVADAVLAILAVEAITPDTQQLEAIHALDSLDEPVRSALIGLLEAFGTFEQRSASSFGSPGAPSDLDGFLVARDALADATKALVDALTGPSSHDGSFPLVADVHAQLMLLPHPKIKGDGTVELSAGPDDGNHTDFDTSFEATVGANDPSVATAQQETHVCVKLNVPPVTIPPRLSIDFSGADNTYTENFAIQIDGCGDDVYENNAGGNNAGTGCGLVVRPAGFLLDLGGDDVYGNATIGCGKVGGGFRGAGFLVDVSGNDAYRGLNDGVIGGGSFGAGFVLDASGDDTYEAGGFGAVGGGFTGVGTLIDAGGADRYSSTGAGTNGGGNFASIGFLLDSSGNDVFEATSFGTNGGANLAVGRLFELDGRDSYSALFGGVNGGGVLGSGLLVDRRGSPDVYVDAEGGSGTDQDVVPKGTGAQLDL